MGLEVLLDILFAPDGSMLTAEDRGREIGTRSDVLQECSRGDTGEIGRLDRRDGRLAAFDHPADGFQEAILRAGAPQQKLHRRHAARMCLLHQVGVAVQLLGISAQMFQHCEVEGKWLAHPFPPWATASVAA